MRIVIDAIYTNGRLIPLEPVDLPENQRVKLTIERVEQPDPIAQEIALQRLLAGINEMNFRSGGEPYPSRDELHDRR